MHSLYTPVAALIEEVAEKVVLPRYQNLAAADISEKGPDDLVTIADKESELRLTEGLGRILPEAGIIGEEAVAADPGILEGASEGLHWIIDPIDGTGNFAAGRPPFGIMVALVEEGAILAGWIYDPLARRLCHAALRQGAYVNCAPVQTRESGAALPIAAMGTYYMTPEQRADLRARAAGRFQVVDIPRCAAEQYPRLVLGQNDVTVFERSLPWDHAAGAIFLNEAGGKLSRQDGTAYIVGDKRRGLLGAATPHMWDIAAEILFA